MSIATRFVSSTARPRLDLSGCVLYAPLWRPDLGGSTFTTIGDGGIPTHLCTVTGATWDNQCRSFNSATPDNIVLNDNIAGSPLNFTSSNWTVGGWFYLNTNAAEEVILYKRVAGTSSGWYFSVNTNGRLLLSTFQLTPASQTTLSTNNDIATKIWFCAIAVRNGANVSFYKNGVLLNNSSSGTHIDPSSTTGATYIGSTNIGAAPWDGKMGELLVKNRVMSVSEIESYYQTTRGRYL